MYAPSEEDRYKVYIIDEAHMLTREAWNALLKILEEPPPRVIFVFATTEPQKIQQAAPPILSRCQRFDFHRIGTADLVARMRDVLAAEQVEAPDGVLLPIAQKADGGMRDALSLLDQVLSFTEGQPTGADVRRVLGLVEDELYLDLAEIIADRHTADVFEFVAELLASGYDLAEFYRGLADFLRTLLILRLEGGSATMREDLHERFVNVAARFEAGDLLRMLSHVAELDADGRFRKSGQQQILIELLLLRFAYLDRTVAIEEIIGALGRGGAGSASGDGGAATAGPRSGRGSGESPARDAEATNALQTAPLENGQNERPMAPPSSGGESQSRGERSEREPAARDETGNGQVAEPTPPSERREGVSSGPAPHAPAQERERVSPPRPPADSAVDAPSQAGAQGAPAAPGPPESARQERPAALDLPPLRAAWRRLLGNAPRELAGMGLMLRSAELSITGAREVCLRLPAGSPLLERLRNPRLLQALEAALAEQLGASVALQFRAAEGEQDVSAPRRITAESAREERLRRLSSEEPLLRAAVQEWDLELIE